jgi:hypothetical protein
LKRQLAEAKLQFAEQQKVLDQKSAATEPDSVVDTASSRVVGTDDEVGLFGESLTAGGDDKNALESAGLFGESLTGGADDENASESAGLFGELDEEAGKAEAAAVGVLMTHQAEVSSAGKGSLSAESMTVTQTSSSLEQSVTLSKQSLVLMESSRTLETTEEDFKYIPSEFIAPTITHKIINCANSQKTSLSALSSKAEFGVNLSTDEFIRFVASITRMQAIFRGKHTRKNHRKKHGYRGGHKPHGSKGRKLTNQERNLKRAQKRKAKRKAKQKAKQKAKALRDAEGKGSAGTQGGNAKE